MTVQLMIIAATYLTANVFLDSAYKWLLTTAAPFADLLTTRRDGYVVIYFLMLSTSTIY